MRPTIRGVLVPRLKVAALPMRERSHLPHHDTTEKAPARHTCCPEEVARVKVLDARCPQLRGERGERALLERQSAVAVAIEDGLEVLCRRRRVLEKTCAPRSTGSQSVDLVQNLGSLRAGGEAVEIWFRLGCAQ